MNILYKKYALVLLALFFISFFVSKSLAPALYEKTPDKTPEAKSTSIITRLKIPSLKIDAAVESLGLTPSGAMDVPKGPDDVAWFNLGTYPGAKGSAVIAGHHGWLGGAVFDQLHNLKSGDLIFVEDDKGQSLFFIVRERRVYAATANAAEVFTSASGRHLNLITCDGDWNKATQSYPQRLVVFTDLVIPTKQK